MPIQHLSHSSQTHRWLIPDGSPAADVAAAIQSAEQHAKDIRGTGRGTVGTVTCHTVDGQILVAFTAEAHQEHPA